MINGNPSAQGGIKVGVGDVFVISGQSNAQGVTSTSSYNESPYDGVVADLHTEDCSSDIPQFPQMLSLYQNYPVATQGPTNWAYTVMGNRLAAQTGCPVAVFNTARYGTAVKNWDDSRNGGAAYNVYTGDLLCGQSGMTYNILKNALNYYSSLFGVRAVIWHQGETDNQQSTTTTDYQNRLNNVISQTRYDFNSSLNWYISRATYNPEVAPFGRGLTWQPVIDAQNNVANSNIAGPATDNLGIPRNGNSSEVHFGGTQLNDLGEAWKNSNLITANPVTANSSPTTVSVVKNGSNFTLTAQTPSGFNQIYWVNQNDKLSLNFSTASSITISGSGSYRYYAKNSQGNIVVSPRVDIPLPSGSARVAAVEPEDQEYNGYNLRIAPNPISDRTKIEVKLPLSGGVMLTVINQQGKVIKTIVDSNMEAGSYEYWFDAGQLPPGTYICRLRSNDFFLSKKIVRVGK